MPGLEVTIRHGQGSEFSHTAVPDTGATFSVIAQDIAQAQGMRVNPTCNETLVTADEKEMEVVGTAQIEVNNKSLRCLVSSSISGEIFFGWQDLIQLGVISPNFPTLA